MQDSKSAGPESHRDSQLRMLRQLNLLCQSCTLCELGRKEAEKDYTKRDPHVLSNMNPARCMIVGQNPGWNELEKREPFVGAAGANFDAEIARHGIGRDNFYITNVVKCWTEGNKKPNSRCCSTCEKFLDFEVSIIKPRIIVALGAAAFESLCGLPFSDNFGRVVKTKFGKVYPVYHPSPLNLNVAARKKVFVKQIGLLCAMIKRGFK